jgi:uncharacterized protein (TIGR02594 family)
MPSMPRTLIEPIPLYIAAALGELGVVEDARPSKSLARIEEYHAATRGGEMPDDVPWCSSFLCFCFERAGYLSTRSKSAASWLTWGAPSTARRYTVCVFQRAGGSGYHVALALGISGLYLFALGGNQRNAVTIERRLVRDVHAWRAPLSALEPRGTA